MRVVEALRSPSGFVHSETRRDAHAALVDSIKAYFRACGWGLLNFGFEKRDDQCDLFEVSTVVVSKLPELDARQEDKEVEDCLSVPWIRFLKGFISGLLEVIAPESENNKIVAATFNKYTRTLTFVVAPESDSNNGEILANIQEEKITGTHQQMGEDSNPKTQELVREEIRSFAPSQPEPDSVVLPDTPVPSIVAYTTSPSVDKLQDAPVLGRVASSSEKEKPESFEIIRRILVASKRHSTRISIMHKVGLTFSEARRYLELLTRSELLETRKLSEDLELVSYRTTSKGIDYIETHEKLDQMIDVNYQPAELANRRVNAKFANSSRANSIPWEESKIWNE